MKKTSPKQLSPGVHRFSDVLPQLITRYGIQRQQNVEALNQVWKSVVKEPYSGITRVLGVKRRTLEISVPHNAFVQELSFRQESLLDEIQAHLPDEKIRKIKFIVHQD